jgi:methylmalonyl-CoA mutase N-terminal domain/subunit
MRDRRDAARVATVLAALSSAAREGRNIMPAVVEAVKAYATVGEITARLAEVYGRYHEPVRF